MGCAQLTQTNGEAEHSPSCFYPKSVVRACLDFGFLEEWILFGFIVF